MSPPVSVAQPVPASIPPQPATDAAAFAGPLAMQLTGQAQMLRGHAYGLRSPAVCVRLELCLHPYQQARVPQLNTAIAALLGAAWRVDAPPGPAPGADAVASLLYWVYRIQQMAMLAVFEPGRALSTRQSDPQRTLQRTPPRASEAASPGASVQAGGDKADAGQAVVPQTLLLAIPPQAGGRRSMAATLSALDWVLEAMNRALDGLELAPCAARLPELMQNLEQASLPYANVPHLLHAASQMGIPTALETGGVVRLGQGVRSRRMDSTFTDDTSVVAAYLARNKDRAARLLAQAGLPVAPRQPVATVEEALQAATRLGYPVVVKPADLDGGVGVAAGLRTAQDVQTAFAQARAHSARLLVEKHIEGRDYRLTVFRGELLAADERVAAGVTGDGTRSVRELLGELNAHPLRRHGKQWPLVPVELDEQARDLLRESGMTPDSVPAPGAFVRLRRANNIGMGGRPVSVLEQTHPDNRELAVRAAAALGLDLAGVDLIMPDITRSWHAGGAVVCEVNGQPGIVRLTSMHLFARMVRDLVPGDGRIATAVVLRSARKPDEAPQQAFAGLAQALARALSARGLVTGLADARGIHVDGRLVSPLPKKPFDGATALLVDRAVQALVIEVADTSLLSHGLPLDRFDVLAVTGVPADVEAASGPALSAMLRTACAGRVFDLMLGVPAGAARPDPAADLRAIAAAVFAAHERHQSQRPALPAPEWPWPVTREAAGAAGSGAG